MSGLQKETQVTRGPWGQILKDAQGFAKELGLTNKF